MDEGQVDLPGAMALHNADGLGDGAAGIDLVVHHDDVTVVDIADQSKRFGIGIIPGSAHIISSFVSYGIERRLSKHPERFGNGAIEGVAGPESANNAAATGAFVPMLALGIPTGPVTAVMLAAIMVHGILPGPMLIQHP